MAGKRPKFVDKVCLVGKAMILRRCDHALPRVAPERLSDGIQAQQPCIGFGCYACQMFELALQLPQRDMGASGKFPHTDLSPRSAKQFPGCANGWKFPPG